MDKPSLSLVGRGLNGWGGEKWEMGNAIGRAQNIFEASTTRGEKKGFTWARWRIKLLEGNFATIRLGKCM